MTAMGLLQQLDDGKKREITEEDYEYFLEVLPPVAFGFAWNGEKWGFGFAEGNDYVYAFKKQGAAFYAQRPTCSIRMNAASLWKSSSRDSRNGSRRRRKPCGRRRGFRPGSRSASKATT